MESKPTTEPVKRKRGRPRKQRTEPPKVEEKAKPKPTAIVKPKPVVEKPKPTPEPESKSKSEAKPEPPKVAPTAEVESDPGAERTITITLPICELSDGDGYQVSKKNPPKQIRTRPLTDEQGIALGAVRLGMIANGAALEGGRKDFFSGGRRSVPIETKEQVVAKILDLIFEAIEEKK